MTVYHSNIKLLLTLTLLIHCYIKINCRYCKKYHFVKDSVSKFVS